MIITHNEGAWHRGVDGMKSRIGLKEKHVLDACHDEGLLALGGLSLIMVFLKNK